MKLIALVCPLIFALMSSAVMARTELLVEYPDQPVVTSSAIPLTSEQVKQAIVDAATQRRWTLSYAAKGDMIEASLSWRTHTIIVSIPYSSTSYSVLYRDSVNMNYGPWIVYDQAGNRGYNVPQETGGKGIHPYYNRRVQELLTSIRANLRKL